MYKISGRSNYFIISKHTLTINRVKSPIKTQILVEWEKITMTQARDAYKRLTLEQKLPRGWQ